MPEYELIKAKYPDYTAQKLIDKDEYLEMTCLDMAKKMSDLELDKLSLERII